MNRSRVLLLSFCPPGTAETVSDHISAIRDLSRYDVFSYPHVGVLSPHIPNGIALSDFDILVIHYSVYMVSDDYLSSEAKDEIRRFSGTKVLFVQDEYRQIIRLHQQMTRLGIDILFTCVPTGEVEKVYPSSLFPSLRKITCLTGYVPERLLGMNVLPIAQRSLDVGYRARKPPYWLGELSAEKWQIVPRFLSHTHETGLKCDLSYQEEDRIYGADWVRFVSSCKTMLGVESGASVFDFDGTIQQMVDEYLARNPDTSFEQVEDRFLQPHEGKIRLNQISPRCFEAAALRTTMVLFEGDYSGILQPWRHYVPLRKDFSNISEVVNAIKNTSLLQEIADRAYREIALNPEYSYQGFVARFDTALDAAPAIKGQIPRPPVSRTWFSITILPAAIFARLVQAWLMIPPAIRSRLKPLTGPLNSVLRR